MNNLYCTFVLCLKRLKWPNIFKCRLVGYIKKEYSYPLASMFTWFWMMALFNELNEVLVRKIMKSHTQREKNTQTSCTCTCLPSRKLYKLYEPDMQDTAGEARTNSSVMYSNWPLHMAKQKQNDQLEHTYSSYVRIRDVALKTCQKRWMIGRSGERRSGISVLAARHNDDIYIYIYIYTTMFVVRQADDPFSILARNQTKAWARDLDATGSRKGTPVRSETKELRERRWRRVTRVGSRHQSAERPVGMR